MLVLLAFASWMPVSAQSSAQAGIFQDYEILPGARVEIPVEIRGVQDLYAIDLELRFDPNVLSFEDADPNTEGIQPALGTFLDAGMTLYNTIDQQSGTVRFVMTQVNPSEPKSGDGIIIVLYAQALQEGDSPLEVVTCDLSTREGAAIDVEPLSASVRVSAAAEESAATAIPVQQATAMPVPTLDPALFPTAAPTATQMPPTPIPIPPTPTVPEPTQAAKAPGVEATEAPVEADPGIEPGESAETDQGFSLAENWWLLVVVFGAVAGLAAVLVKMRRSDK